MEKLLNYSGLEKYNDLIHDELDQKANIDGYYESLGAGTADQLSSNIFEEDSEPYHFRTSGGSIDIGDRETDMLVGGSVAWNQLAERSNYISASSPRNGITRSRVFVDGHYMYNMNGTKNTDSSDENIYEAFSNNIDIYTNHIYLFCTSMPTKYHVTTYGNLTTSYGECVISKALSNATTLASLAIRLNLTTGVTVNDNIDLMFIDLTQMFGSTIADYIYTLEQGQAGAGVAFFRKYFPKPYYPYDSGTIKSVEGVSAHKTVGFNQWDGVYENGYLDPQTGEEIPINPVYYNSKRSSYIDVVGGAAYYFRRVSTGVDSGVFWFYDADKNAISSQNQVRNGTFNTPTNARYMRWAYINMSIAENDICINLSWDGERDGEYEPYVEHSYPLDDSLTLRGIPKIANGKLYYDGDTYESDGTVTRKRKPDLTLDGSSDEDWTYNSSDELCLYITCEVPDAITVYNGDTEVRCICDKLAPMPAVSVISNRQNYSIALISNKRVYVTVPISVANTVAAFRTWLASNPITITYPLATPTTEQAEPFTNPQIVDDFGTEEYITTSIVPVGHYTKYMANLKAKLEMSPDSPNGEGDYIVQQANGKNEYVLLASNATIQDMLARIEALEEAIGGGE